MRNKSKVMLLTVLLVPLFLSAEPFLNVKEIKFERTGEIREVLIIGSAPITRYRDTLKADEKILTIDIDSALYKASFRNLKINDDCVASISGAQFKVTPAPTVRINIKFKTNVEYALLPKTDTLTIIVEKAKETIRISPVLGTFFFYNSYGRRDPFEPLLSQEKSDTLLNVGSAMLVGIIHQGDTSLALLKDVNGMGFVLKKGDRVRGGSVLDIKDNEVVFLLSDYGFNRKVILKLEKDQSLEGRSQ
ncbi:MAG: hypothetical protein J7K11_01290 [Candidatus Hydrothermae bacterium]|nr:hypothetical protein [Candidatus Hydrothermae bacterium]RKZ03863.1 MAG: hypothetical protein DRQ04_01730 [Candidatus Hydrothermae bacterium]